MKGQHSMRPFGINAAAAEASAPEEQSAMATRLKKARRLCQVIENGPPVR
jgi:hypothetical protein